MLAVSCTFCKHKFERSKGRVTEALKFEWKQYCSRKCLSDDRKKGTEAICGRKSCGKVFYRRHSELKIGSVYCSRSCAVSINNNLFPRRLRSVLPCSFKGCSNMLVNGKTFCSLNCYAKARTNFSSVELLSKLKLLSRTLKRSPSRREAPFAESCIRVFGTWNKALVAAGLEPHRSHSQRMYKRTATIATDGHRCDSISEAIIDNWLNDHRILHKRNAPYPETASTSDWSVGDIFIEYFGLANDSKRYDLAVRKKRTLCKQYGIKLIELYAKDLYPKLVIADKLNILLSDNRRKEAYL